MSQIYISGFVIVLAQVLPHIGVTLGNDELTAFATTLITIVAGAWAMIRRYQVGGIGLLGGRKEE
jgi:hypothetical protein